MTLSASYVAAEKSARDQIDWNPEWSRRARGVPVYAALKELGRQGSNQWWIAAVNTAMRSSAASAR